MEPIIVSTENGYEPAFWSAEFRTYCIEPGWACATMAEAEARLADQLEVLARLEGSAREYAMGYSHACGYHD